MLTKDNISLNLSMRMVEMPMDLLIVGTFFYVSIFVVGLIGNFLVLFVLTKEKELRNFTNYLLANLSIADSLTLIICIPVGMHDLYGKERWYLGHILCRLVVFSENLLGIASIQTIFFITLERFYVICRPLWVKSLMTQSRTLKLVIFIWSSSFAVNLPFIYLSEHELSRFYDNSNGYKCILKVENNISIAYIFVVSFLVYFLIGIVLVYMYCKITVQLNKSTLYIFSFSDESKRNSLLMRDSNKTLSSSDKSNPDSRRASYYKTSEGELILLRKKKVPDKNLGSNTTFFKYIRLRRKLIGMLIVVVIAFYLFLFPLKIWNLIFMFLGHKKAFQQIITLRIYWTINIIVRIFFYINSFINPLLYSWLSVSFRVNFKKLLSGSNCSPH